MNHEFISIIIPAHNEQQYIAECLASLISQDYLKEKYEIIVVDNNSKDLTKEIARTFNVQIIDQKSGPVGAVRNAGAKEARGEYLAFIDADCIAPRNWLRKGVEAFSLNSAVYGGGCDIRLKPHWIEKAWLLENKAPPKDLLGCCIFIKKADFFSTGGFDEEITSGEDTKLSVALRARGFDVRMTKSLNVIHLGNPTTLKQFFVRQIWHSENYIKNWTDTKTDPTFYLLLVFLFSLALSFLNLILKNPGETVFFLVITLAVPLIFTFKRLRRSQNIMSNLRNIFAIYFLDFLYLLGRSFGFLKSILKCVAIIRPANRRED